MGLPDAEELSLKAQLVINLQRLMKLHALIQREVAERVGTDQPSISKILRGNLDLVSVEKLLTWHSALDQEVDITIRDRFPAVQTSKRNRVKPLCKPVAALRKDIGDRLKRNHSPD